jgi:ribosomal protein S18 acetylase RimI-like enzyme
LGALPGKTVEPTLQTTGLGKKMLNSIQDYAQQRGAKTTVMNAMNVRKNLIAWYQRRGYVLTGEQEPFIFNQDRHGGVNRTDLSFVVLQKALKP